MPLYDYYCAPCASTIELLTRFDAKPACPLCGGVNMERLLATPAAASKHHQVVAAARAQAGREGHLSHYTPSELKRR